MNIDLKGRVVLVTGAAQGLGKAMALGLVQAGARLVAADLPGTEALMHELGAEIDALGARARFLATYGDVTEIDAAEKMLAAAISRFSVLDGLVNNAAQGMQLIAGEVTNSKRFYEVTPAEWRAMVDVNLNGSFLMSRAAIRYMLPRKAGRIVNILTSRSTMVMRGFTPYGATKAALEAATAAWAEDLRNTGITVNALLPGGAADTRMVPLGTVSDRHSLIPAEVMVPPIVWLMSTYADEVTGKRIIAKDWRPQVAPDRVQLEVALEAGGW